MKIYDKSCFNFLLPFFNYTNNNKPVIHLFFTIENTIAFNLVKLYN